MTDCLHLQLYRDSKDRYKQGQTKASLSLQHFLGVESGFTLDKESNTIAIICQDVTVILAFDSRERLIQWQVKISNNLGEDQQFLIQVSSAPPKAKLASGPARLHVRDQRFCVTVGVPPRLVGLWEIGQLRRYGVVEGRFCFEGGSRCGRGEGLHVCVTDQGEEVTRTFQLAAQGRLAARRRPVVRKTSAMDSPRKQLHSRAEVRISDLSCAESLQQQQQQQQQQHHQQQQQHQQHQRQAPGDLTRSLYAEEAGCCCSMTDSMLESSRRLSSEDLLCPCRVHSGSPFWSSAESSGHQHTDLDSNYGCGDTSSVSDMADAHYHHDHGWGDCERRPGPASLERCASCIGKLGAPSMSRSSTATNTNTPNTPFSPAWTMEGLPPSCGHLARAAGDRASLSSHGSSGQSEPQLEPCWYDRPRPAPPVVPPKSARPHPTSLPVACRCCPPARPPKPPSLSHDSPTKKRAKKPPMPLPPAPAPPGRWPPLCACPHPPPPLPEPGFGVGPYENYDVPKSVLGRDHNKEQSRMMLQMNEEYYDTPKSLKECLVASGCDMAANSPYGNYDTPPTTVMMKKPCGCVVKYSKKTMVLDTARVIVDAEERTSSAADCPCRRVMCWAENFMMIPYCRRGNGMENTGVPIQKVKLSGEGKMPVMNSKGEIAIYATIDKSKKTNRRQQLEHEKNCSLAADAGCESQLKTETSVDTTNYVNVAPCGDDQCPETRVNDADNIPPDMGSETYGLNYENIEFAQSLEYYENSRDVLSRAGIIPRDQEHVNERENLLEGTAEDVEGSVTYTLCNGVKFCNKCGHACHYFPNEQPPEPDANQGSTSQAADVNTKQDDYLMMEPGKNIGADKAREADPAKAHSGNFPGYLPMSPITNAGNKAEVLKIMSKSLTTEKSASSPSLTVPSGDRSRKRSNSEFPRIPGSAMMMNHSANSPYMRRMLFESSEESRREYLMSRKRSSSADSSRYLDDFEDVENASVTEDSVASSHETSNISQDLGHVITSDEPDTKLITESKSVEKSHCIHPVVVQQSDKKLIVEDTCPQEVVNPPEDLVSSAPDRTLSGDCVDGDVQQQHGFKTQSAIHIRRSSSVPCKSGNNRDSSSSNDSGVSTDSLRHRGADFVEFELPLTTAMSARRHYHAVSRNSNSLGNCLHASLPRRSKSVDPLRELSFQFQKIKIPAKSSSAEAEVPICPTKGSKGFASPGADGAVIVPYIDSRSTSSGTSDMSDYIETLSLSSHSSSDTPGDSLRLGRPATTTLRPRSGKEYQLIDRSVLESDVKTGERASSQLRSLSQYANITPLLEKCESPSPGYMSGSPGQEREGQPLGAD